MSTLSHQVACVSIQPTGCRTLSVHPPCNPMVEQKHSGVDVGERRLSALTDPAQRAIGRRLASGEATVSELSEPFEMSFQAVSKRVQVLEHAGLVTRTRRAQERPCRLLA